jgi:hypothetical protein
VSHHPHAGNEDTPGETPMFSPDETPAHTPGGSPKELSPRSSSEAIEKGVKNENVSKALRYSLTGPAAAAVAFHRGRSNVEMLLRTDIDAVPADTAGVAVGVCGPTTRAARSAASTLLGPCSRARPPSTCTLKRLAGETMC